MRPEADRMTMPLRLARLWLLGLPIAFALFGIFVSVRPAFSDSVGQGEDWSILVGTVMIVVAMLALVTSLPGFILLKRMGTMHTSRQTRISIWLIATPVIGALLPFFGAFRTFFIPGAVASIPALVVLTGQYLRRRRK